MATNNSINLSVPLIYVSLILTSSQIKALHGTPIQVIPAQGAGKVISILSNVYCKFNYGGSNVFIAGAAQTVSLFYGTTNLVATGSTNAMLIGSTSTYLEAAAATINGAAIANLENQPLNLYNSVATEITGNAANDNTITLSFIYYVISI